MIPQVFPQLVRSLHIKNQHAALHQQALHRIQYRLQIFRLRKMIKHIKGSDYRIKLLFASQYLSQLRVGDILLPPVNRYARLCALFFSNLQHFRLIIQRRHLIAHLRQGNGNISCPTPQIQQPLSRAMMLFQQPIQIARPLGIIHISHQTVIYCRDCFISHSIHLQKQ